MLNLPTLRQLQFFQALIRCRSFSKAAEECFVSQSALSTAIKELERGIGRQLIDRSTRAFALTVVGEDVAARAAAILAMSEDLVRAARARKRLDGPFHLGVIPTIAPFILPRAAAELRERFPKLLLYLREDLTASLVERLAAGLIDAAVLALPYAIPRSEVIDIADDPFWFAAARGHRLAKSERLTVDDLKGEDLMLLEDGHCLRDQAIEACKLQHPAAASFAATSLFTLVQMVEAGVGATLLPEMAVKAGLARSDRIAVRPFAPPVPARRIGLAWRKGSGRGDEAEAVAEAFRKVLRAPPPGA
jgi:LysR family hydrogen peroxide-inducible transcriptional activator